MTNCLHSVSFDSFFAAMNPDPMILVYGNDNDNNDSDGSHKVKESRPNHLVVAPSPFFTVPPGLSPSALLDSPQSPLWMSHQQALAQVTTQAMQANDEPLILLHPSFTLNDANSKQKVAPFELEQSEISHTNNNKHQMPSSLTIDKPADDGYNWRKYGQKQAKGSEFPRSYYKCTHLNCHVKKKVERASDGHITEIIYKGQHRHKKPKGNRGVKDNNYDSNENVGIHHAKYESNLQQGVDCSVSIEGEEMGDEDIWEEEGDESEPNLKRRNTNVGVSEVPLPHKSVTEPKIIVQTRSEVDILDDGYRWRKYGQKVVKGSPHPRSYYKCTSAGCKVRKHVERASMDPKAVITTYEGKHNHDVPTARNCISHNIATINSMPLKPHKVVPPKLPLLKDMDFGNNDHKSCTFTLKRRANHS